MPKYTSAELKIEAEAHFKRLQCNYDIRDLTKVIKRFRAMLQNERQRRRDLPDSERGIDRSSSAYKDNVHKAKAKKKPKKSTKKKSPQRKGMFASLCELFDEKGVNKVALKEAVACAKEAKPDSNLSKGHLQWYKKKYRESGKLNKTEATLENKLKKKINHKSKTKRRNRFKRKK